MKRVFLMAVLLGLSHNVFAIQSISENINTASTTYTNDSFKRIPGSLPGSELFAVVVPSATSGGVLGLYDSSGAASGFISSVTLQAIYNPIFQVRVSSGITYTTTGNANGVVIIYRNPTLP